MYSLFTPTETPDLNISLAVEVYGDASTCFGNSLKCRILYASLLLQNTTNVTGGGNQSNQTNTTDETGTNITHIIGSIMDSYGYNSPSCPGDEYSCGNTADGILDVGGTINATIAVDDGLATYWCATLISGNNATTSTCIIRNGFNNTICDGIITGAVNKSEWYTSPTANLTGIGWNGLNSIPVFGVPAPTKQYQINTSVSGTKQYIFIEYKCNQTPLAQIQTNPITFVIGTQKGVVCDGNEYRSVVYTSNNASYSLSRLFSCTGGSFCDPSLLSNATMLQNVSSRVCTPGCTDGTKNGGETDVDYGGVICGNCTPLGKTHDTFYSLSVELQTNDRGTLSTQSPFNATLYCPLGQETGSSSIALLAMVLIVSTITVLFLLLLILSSGTFFFVVAGRRIRRYFKKK